MNTQRNKILFLIIQLQTQPNIALSNPNLFITSNPSLMPHPLPTTPIPSSILCTRQPPLLTKYGHAYFPLRSIQQSKVSQRTKSLLNSYPCWFVKQSLASSRDFQEVARNIVQADPKEVYLFEETRKAQGLEGKIQACRILSSVDGIRFAWLKVLHVMLVDDGNFEQVGWVDAPVLEELYISTQGCFTSIKPLQKSCFKQLYMVNFRASGAQTEIKRREPRMFDLSSFSRTRFLSLKFSPIPKPKLYTPPGTITITRSDLSNISHLTKLQLPRLTNIHVPHLPFTTPTQHHHFTPNAQYPWCPQLQFSQSRIYKALNRRFDNKTVALSIVDYVMGGELGNVRGNYRNGNDEDGNDDDDGIDSDLDGYDEQRRGGHNQNYLGH